MTPAVKAGLSACLAGEKCRYDGGDCLDGKLLAGLEGTELILVCPEVLGGLPVPRVPAEIEGGDGGDVLSGKASVINREGGDVTAAFIWGAETGLRMLEGAGVKTVYLKEKSPSCGVSRIKRGGQEIEGRGVFAALLLKRGFNIKGV